VLLPAQAQSRGRRSTAAFTATWPRKERSTVRFHCHVAVLERSTVGQRGHEAAKAR
jgi:hypothetical protein